MATASQHRIRKRSLKVAHFAGLFLAMSIICLPGLWVVLNSFRPTVEIMAKPPVWIPESLSLDHYRAMFGGAGEGAGHAERELLAHLARLDHRRDAAQGLAVGVGEHRLVVVDDLEAHGVPERAGGRRGNAGPLGHLGPGHRGRAAEEGALDEGREVDLVARREGDVVEGLPEGLLQAVLDNRGSNRARSVRSELPRHAVARR